MDDDDQRDRLRRTAERAARLANERLPAAERLSRGRLRRFVGDLLPVLLAYERQAAEADEDRELTREALRQLRRARTAKAVKAWRTRNLVAALDSLPADARRQMAVAAEALGLLPWPAEDQGAGRDVVGHLSDRLQREDDRQAYQDVAAIAAETLELRRGESWRADHRGRLLRGILEVWHRYTGRGMGQVRSAEPAGEGGGSILQALVLALAGDPADTGEADGVRPRLGRQGVLNAIMEFSRPGAIEDPATRRR